MKKKEVANCAEHLMEIIVEASLVSIENIPKVFKQKN